MSDIIKSLGLGLLLGAGCVSLLAVITVLAVLGFYGPDMLVAWVLG